MEIVTERLRLRRPRSDDLDAMFEIMSDPRAMRFWSTLPHSDRDVTRAWLDREIAQLSEGGDDFVIEHEGRVIGKVGAWQMPELGYILHPDWWGRGFAFEACSAYIDHAFAAFPIDFLTADVDPRNAASLALLARLGFVETGKAERTFLIGGQWYDSIYLALARPI